VRATARRYAAAGGEYAELPENAHWIQGESKWRETVRRCLDWIEARAGQNRFDVFRDRPASTKVEKTAIRQRR